MRLVAYAEPATAEEISLEKKCRTFFSEPACAKLEPDRLINLIQRAWDEAWKKSTTKRPSPFDRAILRGIAAWEELKQKEGGSYSSDEVRPLLGSLSKQAVLDRYHKGHLLGWREGKQKAVRFPVWQFDDKKGGLLDGLPEALAELRKNPHLDDFGKILFFLNPRESLGGKRPLDLLREGRKEKVPSMARSYVE